MVGLRVAFGGDWNEFLRFSLRSPEPEVSLFENHEVDDKTPIPTGAAPVFDTDVSAGSNAHVPISLWVDASGNALLPGYMQLRIAQVGWLRAMLLAKAEEARKLMQRVQELQPGSAELAQSFLSAHDPEEARLAALFIILRIPSLHPQLPSPEILTTNFAAPHYLSPDVRCWYYPKEPQPIKPSPIGLRFLTSEQRTAGETGWKPIRPA